MPGRAHAFVISLMLAMAPAGDLRPQDAEVGETTSGSWSVTGVAKDDVLHMRDVPSGDSQSIAKIPPDAKGLRNLGCLSKQLSLDDWAGMTKEQRRLTETRWCRVEYQGKQGWVAARFIVREEGGGK